MDKLKSQDKSLDRTSEQSQDKPRRHTLAIQVDNRPGVLARVITLISGRGFNIDSLSVSQTMDPEVSIITLIVTGSPKIISQIIKQLRKLINVIKVTDLSHMDYVERQLIIVRIKAEDETDRSEIMRLCKIFRAKVVDVSLRSFTLEITGGSEKIKACLNLLKVFGIEEQVSTGLTAMTRSTPKDQVATTPRSSTKSVSSDNKIRACMNLLKALGVEDQVIAAFGKGSSKKEGVSRTAPKGPITPELTALSEEGDLETDGD